jgi:hypothetical protein
VISWRAGEVTALGREWAGAVECRVVIDGGREVPALAYPELTGRPGPGDRVLVNATALDLDLGTGGYAFVVALPGRLPPPRRPAGHLVKARYTPLQVCLPGADEPGSPHYQVLRDADDLGGMPVVVADLHSALPAVLAGIYGVRDPGAAPPPRPTVCYVMLDGGALPAWFSRTVAGLRQAGWLATAISTGQAFGGDLETVTVHSGLLAARHVAGAELAIVTQGPGNLGTGTRWGFSGVACGEAVNAAAVLGGRPVAALRVSQADPRHRPDRLRPGGAGPGRRGDPPPARRVRRGPRRPGGQPVRAAQPGHRERRRPGRGAARLPGEAVHDGPRPG